MLCIYSMCIIMYIYYSCFYDGINNIDRQINTMFYNNGSIYTNYWYTWFGKNKQTEEELSVKGYAYF